MFRNILQENNIDYVVKTVDRTSPTPMAAGLRGGAEELNSPEKGCYERQPEKPFSTIDAFQKEVEKEAFFLEKKRQTKLTIE